MLEAAFAADFEPAFPYMRFARTEALRAEFPLTQSGMPAADAQLFADIPAADFSFAGKELLPKLRAQIAAHVGASPEDVFVALGASGAMHLAASTLFRPGVRVATETPTYDPLHALPRHFGAQLTRFERSPRDDWRIDPAAVARALAGARPGHVFLTNPHNPSGALLGEGEVAALAREAERAGGLLLSNETYMEYVPAARRVRAHRLAPNTLSIGSLTKAYGLGPLRIGWIVLGPALAGQRARFEDALNLDYVDPPSVSLRLGVRAFEHLDQLRAPIERFERESKPEFARWHEAHPRIRGRVSEFGLIAFPQIAGVGDTRAFGRFLLDRESVGIVPGEFFGLPGHVRMGFGLPVERLREALVRFDRGLGAWRG